MEETGSDNKKLNYIQTALVEKEMSSRVLGLCLDIHKGTLTNWTNNITQPNLENIEKIAELLELDNYKLINNTKRKDTGLISALVAEYKRLTNEEKMGLYVTVTKDGKTKKTYNPELQSALWDFIENFRKKISETILTDPVFIDKYYKDIEDKERLDESIFICKALPQEGKPYFEYLVVNESLGEDHFVARFARKEDAEAYVEWLENAD
ncbi:MULTISPECIES: helix-turn-helix domain-containing protein [Sphingobacterium]|uniref:Helix-turn-helix transcriptional regulator n=1 Tax=Sphingobacterium phlebotomi TaxID=2605433 RepID=A0A5D4H7D0_9SPHI|nr:MULTISPECIES: helix-turn-helix domain-containing protein [Sphingobacterium]NGM67320.1 helix-turn-helix transcriptional regulator [Sphingobacterium sp. SGR-19]TYR36163.1 helix-turn-helix transcriptional regulator [Sphingobacterium phlebotomi]